VYFFKFLPNVILIILFTF